MSIGPIEQSPVFCRLARFGFKIEKFIELLTGGRQDFEQLCADLEAEIQPRELMDDIFFHHLVMAHWRIAMCDQRDANLVSQSLSDSQKSKYLRQNENLRLRALRSIEQWRRELAKPRKHRGQIAGGEARKEAQAKRQSKKPQLPDLDPASKYLM